MTINPRLIELARRTSNKDLPSEIPANPRTPRVDPTPVHSRVESSFILSYDDYGKELISKSNESFRGTKAEIPLDRNSSGEVPNMHILKRLALITAIYNNPSLRSMNLWPITPLQSEQLLKEGKLPNPSAYWEDLGLLLYDRSANGSNPKEAKALYESLKKHRTDLGFSASDLESKLLIVNAGLEKDTGMPHGVNPVVLPGLTKAYRHETLSRTGADHRFEYGLENGLPNAKSLGNGNRNLYMPSQNENIGLRVLFRFRYLYLGAWNEDLVDSVADGRVNVARVKM